MSNWNGNRFSIYASEEKNVLRLIEELGGQTNANTDALANKTDLTGDHKGSWQGLQRPTMSEEGLRATVEKIVDEDLPKINSSLETNIIEINNFKNRLNLLTNDDNSLRNYCTRVLKDGYWNTQYNDNYWGRNIVLLGDSHSWGQGGQNYNDNMINNSHCENILNGGYYGKLKKYIYEKWNTCPLVIEGDASKLGVERDGITFYEHTSLSNNLIMDKNYYRKQYEFLDGSYSFIKDYLEDNENYELKSALACNVIDSALMYNHNSFIGLLLDTIMICKNTTTNKPWKITTTTETPTKVIALSFFGDVGSGKIAIYFNQKDGVSKMGELKDTAGYSDYNALLSNVKCYRSLNDLKNKTNAITMHEDTIFYNDEYGLFTINTSNFIGETMIYMDLNAQAEFRMTIQNNNNDDTKTFIRGVVLSNLDMIKNFSYGGHTIGAWLGEESNWNGSDKNDHISPINSLMYFPPKLVLVQAPIVNEYIRQTPLHTFKERLSRLKNNKLFTTNNAQMVIFNTIGDIEKEFGVDNGNIKYEDYFNALKEWVNDNIDVSFLDCRKQLLHLVNTGILKPNDLYSNNIHPSPTANEIIYDMLKEFIKYKI